MIHICSDARTLYIKGIKAGRGILPTHALAGPEREL